MKLSNTSRLFLLLITTTCFLVTAASANSLIEKAGLDYIQHLSKGTLNLAEHTAISENCTKHRTLEINNRLKSITKNKFHNEDTFYVEEVKSDGNLAAVLIRSTDPASPFNISIHAVAIIKKNDTWIAAPLPGTFINSGYGYDLETEKKVHSLEQWMTNKRKPLEKKYQDKELQAFTSKLLLQGKSTPLTDLSPEDAVIQFISYCQKKDTLSALVSLGVLNKQPNSDTTHTIKTLTQGLKQNFTNNAWNLITNENLIIQPINNTKDSTYVSIGFYNPYIEQNVSIINFSTYLIEGKTYVRLPKIFINSLSNDSHKNKLDLEKLVTDRKSSKAFILQILHNRPSLKATTAQLAYEHLTSSFTSKSFSEFIRLVPRKGEYFSEENNQHNAVIQLSSLWKEITLDDTKHSHTISPIVDDNLAIVSLQSTDAKQLGKFKTHYIWFIKEEDTWHLISNKALKEIEDDALKTSQDRLFKELEKNKKQQEVDQTEAILKSAITLNFPTKFELVNTEQGIELLKRYRKALRNSDTKNAMLCCALVDKSSNKQILKTLRYSIRGAIDQIDDDQIIGNSTAGNILGISMRTQSKLGDRYDYPLYLISNTKDGARIILDVDLRYEINKGRKLLNENTWTKLSEKLPDVELKKIQSIMRNHNQFTEQDIKKIKEMMK